MGYNPSDTCTASDGPGAVKFNFVVDGAENSQSDITTALGCDYYEHLLRFTNYELGIVL